MYLKLLNLLNILNIINIVLNILNILIQNHIQHACLLSYYY